MDASKQSATSTTASDLSESSSKQSSRTSKMNLESLAESFQQELFRQNLMQEFSLKQTTVASVFSGSDAVDIILDLLPPSMDRQDALNYLQYGLGLLQKIFEVRDRDDQTWNQSLKLRL